MILPPHSQVEQQEDQQVIRHPDCRQPLTQLLQVCFELSGGSQLSGKPYNGAWGRFVTTHVKYWASTRSSAGLVARRMLLKHSKQQSD